MANQRQESRHAGGLRSNILKSKPLIRALNATVGNLILIMEVLAKNLAELCSRPGVLWKAELESNETRFSLVEEIFKPIVRKLV